MADASTTVADVIVPKGNFGGGKRKKYGQQRGYSNETAASELYSGAKSKKVPIHDSMGGYNGQISTALLKTNSHHGRHHRGTAY